MTIWIVVALFVGAMAGFLAACLFLGGGTILRDLFAPGGAAERPLPGERGGTAAERGGAGGS